MNFDRLKEILDKIPATLLLVVFLGYLGSDYYSFMNDPASPLTLKQHEADAQKAENAKLQVKIKETELFLRGLEAKKIELRKLAGDLESMKGTLSETLDLPEFMKTTLSEAKRVGLTVVSLRPGGFTQKEFYSEQIFDMAFKGVYIQLMLFLDHMASVQKIVRVDNFDIRPHSSANARFVELEGTVQIKAYRYVASKADALGREESSPGAPSGNPSAPGNNPNPIGNPKPPKARDS